jgi:hypothetical protein
MSEMSTNSRFNISNNEQKKFHDDNKCRDLCPICNKAKAKLGIHMETAHRKKGNFKFRNIDDLICRKKNILILTLFVVKSILSTFYGISNTRRISVPSSTASYSD